ncbi:MAG: hypothetical protein ACT4PZ_22770 [Panacagrimonas sp.]
MEEIVKLSVILEVGGLLMTMTGALIEASGAVVKRQEARQMAHTADDHNPKLEKAVINQSNQARRGFVLIAIGSLTHILGILAAALGA